MKNSSSFRRLLRCFMVQKNVHQTCTCIYTLRNLFWTMGQCMASGIFHLNGSMEFLAVSKENLKQDFSWTSNVGGVSHQDLLLSDVSSILPPELGEFFNLKLGKHYEVIVSKGSVEQSNVDASPYLSIKGMLFVFSRINATECIFHKVHQRYKSYWGFMAIMYIVSCIQNRKLSMFQCFINSSVKWKY